MSYQKCNTCGRRHILWHRSPKLSGICADCYVQTNDKKYEQLQEKLKGVTEERDLLADQLENA